MEHVVEFLTDVVFGLVVGVFMNKKVPRFIRYLLYFIAFTVIGILVSGVLLLVDGQRIGLLFISISVIIALGAIWLCQKYKKGIRA